MVVSNPSVTVIIPSVRNHEELDVVLKGLRNQTYTGPYEIVVVGPTNDPGRGVCEENNIRFIDDEGSKTRADACILQSMQLNLNLYYSQMTM